MEKKFKLKAYYVLDDNDVKQIKKQMVDKDLNFSKMAENLGLSRGYLSLIMQKKRSITPRIIKIFASQGIYLGGEADD